jgi:polyhydroxyalkanoate synthesis regulator phasin
MHELERQLLSSQILVESLADILIQKGIMTQEEIQEVCQERVDALTAELRKEEKKQVKKTKTKQSEAEILTTIFMGNQIGEA